ncbi:transglycosylase SLT domain-containing protein [Motiliproteus sp. MSK22-1]|uniref:transglycosylase SLT domain-containing protein n=1 Tax=Motiliproteus sp. MSK22-1 TaxID=1897630 RepID=UPI00097ABA0A|nr:transglycosylase SLT domain-containing protein [Motiliproteus sp. MSK22-1]OMH38732.1 hypothetical protein BGP75_05960 [Motiliproteus sp. MSK22-1]
MQHQPQGVIRLVSAVSPKQIFGSLTRWRHKPLQQGLLIILGLIQPCIGSSALAKTSEVKASVSSLSEIAPAAPKPDFNTTAISPQKLRQLRSDYKKARKAITTRNTKQLQILMPALVDYPLYPYLHYSQITSDLSKLNQKNYNDFMESYKDTPLPSRLESKWLSYLAKRKRWNNFLDNYPANTSSTSRQCQRLWALHQTGKKKLAYSQVLPLWKVGRSQPKSCDKIFRNWIKAGHLKEQDAWQRFWLVLENGNRSLARYVGDLIKDSAHRRMVTTAINLHKDPVKLAKLKLPSKTPGYTQLVVTSLKRLVWKDPEQALQLWQKLEPTLTLNTEQKLKLRQRLGLSMLKKYHPRSGYWLKQLDPKIEDPKLIEWGLRFHLSNQDWEAVEKLIAQLSPEDKDKGRWRYWLGRAMESNGSKPKAIGIFTELSRERSFYGFLAADRIGQTYSLNNSSQPVDQKVISQLSKLPALNRARELFHHDQLLDARREWWKLSRQFSADQHIQSAHIARRWGWYTQAIRATIYARHWDDLRLRFPAPYSQSISTNAQRFSIDIPWIFAVTRQESAFAADVRSPAGAVGLMQLMPATAKQTAKSINLRYKGSHQLKNPSTNIQLGSAYLSKMLERHQGNRVHATAAYNAGPHRVKGWLEKRGALPVDLWIESIPFDETRQYVQNVLSYSVIYSDLLGQPKQFLTPVEASKLPPIN